MSQKHLIYQLVACNVFNHVRKLNFLKTFTMYNIHEKLNLLEVLFDMHFLGVGGPKFGHSRIFIYDKWFERKYQQCIRWMYVDKTL